MTQTTSDSRRLLTRYRNLRGALEMIDAEVIAYRNEYRCLGCDHFDVGNGYCSHWKAAPPEDALRAGCDSWTIELPF